MPARAPVKDGWIPAATLKAARETTSSGRWGHNSAARSTPPVGLMYLRRTAMESKVRQLWVR